MWTDFRAFIARGNVIDLSVGVVIGASFGKIVTSLVEGIIMPPIGMMLGRIDFSSLFVVLDTSKGVPASLADAKTKAIPVLAYGQFINDVLGFLIVALAIFVVIRQVNRVKATEAPEREAPPTTRACPFCVSAIPIGATRCPQCTSQL